jgi:hypothetical protein
MKGIPGTTHMHLPRLPALFSSHLSQHRTLFPHANARPRPPIALVPPRSALKQTPSPSGGGGPSTPATNGKYAWKHCHSVSFSDGKKDGKIQNLSVSWHVDENEDDGHDQSVRDDTNNDDQSGGETSVSIAQSTHTRRIEGMLVALEAMTHQRCKSLNPLARCGRYYSFQELSAAPYCLFYTDATLRARLHIFARFYGTPHPILRSVSSALVSISGLETTSHQGAPLDGQLDLLLSTRRTCLWRAIKPS